MPRGSKEKYSNKQKRMAEHIEDSYENRGTGKKEVERRAWATVNKETGGGEKSGSGRKKSATSKAKARRSVGRSAAATRKHRGTNTGSRKAGKKSPTPAKRSRSKKSK